MERRYDIGGPSGRTLNAQEAEELFSKVDNSGHANEERAESQREHRRRTGHGVVVDPLSTDDPSGSTVGITIRRVAAAIAIIFVGAIIFTQFYVSNARSENTANLSNNVSVSTVALALAGGIEWGNGFTQFPSDFSVQEADQNTGRIEVSVVDTTSSNALVCFSNTQIQATAFSSSSLLNPNIDTVIYHVNVHVDEEGNIQKSSMFGFFRPTGDLSPYLTFIWHKTTGSDGQVRFNCTVTGVDEELQETLRGQILKQSPDSEDEVERAQEAIRRADEALSLGAASGSSTSGQTDQSASAASK
ncbi:MAG: hypothetical protein Q4B54_02060 [Coriobacteriales bacterium]|nr:hypothetical protein [Coriobacteriales bacterium]